MMGRYLFDLCYHYKLMHVGTWYLTDIFLISVTSANFAGQDAKLDGYLFNLF